MTEKVQEWSGNFKLDKECKHSRRYAAASENFPIRSIYVDRKVANGIDSFVVVLAGAEEEK